jgi:glycosyltransferase involved in cell wall biosynthesis
MALADRVGVDLVSIVLPTHNGARYIEQSINSCLNLTYRNWELVIVDDGSTDDTPSKIARYADDRIRVIRHAMNRGLSAALNTGFASARGDFLTWTSDDNYYRPVALERMLTFLREHPEVDFVYADYEFVDEAGVRAYYFEVQPPLEGLLHGNCVGGCFLYRRRVYEVVGRYAEDIALAEDYDYWLRVSISFRMAPLHENLYCYRLHAQSLTSRFPPTTVTAAMNKSLRRHLREIPWADARMRASVYMNEARRALFEGRMADLVRYLTLSVSLAPGWAISHVAVRLGRLTAGVFSR